jgi:hypothetical protein
MTGEPIRENQHGLTVLAHQYVYSVGTDAVEANSTVNVINATAHVAQIGDVIRVTSGAQSGRELKVMSVSTDTITLAEQLDAALATAVTFQILRHKYPVINSDGSIPVTSSPGPVSFTRDAVTTTVTEDTITPANNRPLPVKLTGVTGDITITANDLNVSLSHTNDSVRIGDGTDIALVTAAGELNVLATAQPGVDIGDVTINNASIAVTGPLTDAELRATPVPVSATNLDVRDLVFASDKVDVSGSSVTVSATNLDIRDLSSATDSIAVTDGGGSITVDGSLTVSSTDLDIRDLVFATDKVDVSGSSVTVTATNLDIRDLSSSTDSVSITDGGGSITVDGSVTVSATDLDVRDLVFATDKVDVSGSSVTVTATNLDIRDLSSSTDSIAVTDGGGSLTIDGSVTVSATNLDVRDLVFATDKVDVSGSTVTATVALLDTAEFVRNDYSSTNVTTGAYVELIASTAFAVKKMQIFDSSGQTLKIATGAAASEVDRFLVFPGGNGDVEITIPAGTRISIRAVSASATVGEISINLFK